MHVFVDFISVIVDLFIEIRLFFYAIFYITIITGRQRKKITAY